MVGGLAHDVLYPWGEHGILIAHGDEEEDASSEHIVEVIGHESSHQLVFLFSQAVGLSCELTGHDVHVASVHDGLVVLMHKFALLVLQLIFLEEAKQLVVERASAYHLLCIVKLDRDGSALQDKGQHGLIVHKDIGHSYRIKCAVEMELPVNDVTGVDALELCVLQNFQVEHTSVQGAHIGSSGYVVTVGTRCQRQ